MKRLLLIMLSVVFLFGCTPYSPSYYPEEDLIVYPMRNAIYYEYQKKVAIQIRYSSNKTDSLSLRIDGDDDSWLSTNFNYKSILTGTFEKMDGMMITYLFLWMKYIIHLI